MREYHVTILHSGGGFTGFRGSYANQGDAVMAGDEIRNGRPGVVHARPDQERTYSEGHARWPQPLHPQAFVEAFLGWRDRDEEARRPNKAERAARDHEERAFQLQLRAGVQDIPEARS